MPNPTWLADVLKAAGLPVVEHGDWKNRGRGPMGPVRGIICHHTGSSPKAKSADVVAFILNGRPDLAGPLSQICLTKDGVPHLLAAGRCNHAGAGVWKGITTGNSSFIGIEAQNSGGPEDPWPAVQLEAYAKACAAILKRIGASVDMCIGHKEWAPRRKIDPSFDMKAFRERVRGYMG